MQISKSLAALNSSKLHFGEKRTIHMKIIHPVSVHMVTLVAQIFFKPKYNALRYGLRTHKVKYFLYIVF